MDPTSYLTLLLQVPLVGAFIWYSLRVSHEFLNALERRDEAFEKRNAALIQAINNMSESIAMQIQALTTAQREHDNFTRENTSRLAKPVRTKTAGD